MYLLVIENSDLTHVSYNTDMFTHTPIYAFFYQNRIKLLMCYLGMFFYLLIYLVSMLELPRFFLMAACYYIVDSSQFIKLFPYW